jgi:hypothetical protein
VLVSVPAGVAGEQGWRDSPGMQGRPSRSAVEDAVSAAPEGARVVLAGGDVLARADAPELLAGLRRSVEVETVGPLLRSPTVLELLATFPDLVVRVTLFSAQSACHDWIVERDGEARAVLRGIRAAAAAGLSVHVEIPLTRPGLGGLAETARSVAALGARSVGFRALRLAHVPPERAVSLGARVGLAGTPVAGAAAEALRRGMRLELRGLPVCSVPPGLAGWRVSERADAAARCAACPATCPGLDPAYVALFGPLELRASPVGESEHAEISWTATEPSREVRRRLVRALEHRAPVLTVRGERLLENPHAADLLREAVRAAPRVELVTELAPLTGWSDDALFRVRKLATATATDAGPAADEGRARLAALGVAT